MAQDNTFTKLTRVEVIQALDEILTYRGDLLLWNKGSSKKEKFRAEDFDEKTMTLMLLPVLASTNLKGKQILLTFESKNLQYFTTSTLNYDSKTDRYTLSVTNDFFKCDKRKNFRIAASDLDGLSVMIKQRSYNGFDLSVGGVSFLIPAGATIPFKVHDVIDNITIIFNGHQLTTEQAEVRYLLEVKDYFHDTTNTKVGLMFTKTTDQFEATIFKEINNAIYKKLNPLGDR